MRRDSEDSRRRSSPSLESGERGVMGVEEKELRVGVVARRVRVGSSRCEIMGRGGSAVGVWEDCQHFEVETGRRVRTFDLSSILDTSLDILR